MSDPKDEIDLLFQHRADDRHTFWPMVEDRDRGNPYDECVCGHLRERHGFKGHVGGVCSLGRGVCTDMVCPTFDDPPEVRLRSCTCRGFILKKRASERDQQ